MSPLLALRERASRLRLYAAVAAGFFALGLAGALRHGPELNLIHGDGRGYYVYLPSAVVDGDLDFSNQIREHSRLEFSPLGLKERTDTGLVWNKFPIGMALSLLPAFLVAHVLSLAAFAATRSPLVAPHGYSLLYQCFCFAAILAYAVATLALADRWLTQRLGVDGRATALAGVAFWIGSAYSYYSFYNAFMVHVVSAFWVAASAACALRLREAVEDEQLVLRVLPRLAFSFSMAVVCRPSNVFVAPFLIGLAVSVVRGGALGRFARALPRALLPGLLPVGLQIATWRALTGSAFVDPYSHEGFTHWRDPRLWQTLVSSRHGLFFWSPLLLLSVWGVVHRLRTQGADPLLRDWLLAFLLLWYANSAWYAWWFGEAFGARAFLELAPLFVMGLAFAYEGALARGAGPVVLRLVSVAFITWNWVLLVLWSAELISRNGYLI